MGAFYLNSKGDFMEAKEMEQAYLAEREAGHKAITNAVRDMEKLGYLISGIDYVAGSLVIRCYCPKTGEGNGLSMDGISESFKA
jgi:hypothetical protein